METSQQYYRRGGPIAAVDARAAGFDVLPRGAAALCEVIQGLLIHRDLASVGYGVPLTERLWNDAQLRPMSAMVARLHAIDGRPLAMARAPGARMGAVCRHFSLMLCAMLQAQGVGARARCGFGAYFTPGRFEDHWVCEYWNDAQARWVLADAQLDAVQHGLLRIDFDPLDVPRDRFIVAGDAWQMCRSGRADPQSFGLSFVPNLRGAWFIAGNVVRDLAALNRMEMLPWDVWGVMPGEHEPLTADRAALLDRVAALELGGDRAFAELRAAYHDDRLRVPPLVFNALRNTSEKVPI